MKGMMELSEKVIYDDLTHHFKDKNFRKKKYIYILIIRLVFLKRQKLVI